MGTRGPRHLRHTTNVVLDALVQAAEQSLHGQAVSMEALHGIVDRLKTSADFGEFYRRSYRELMEIVEDEKIEQRRANCFGRLVIHPLTELLDEGTLSRDLLPNVFSFIHLVLGDEAEAYGRQCQDIVASLREELLDEFTWDAFYDDQRAKPILWHTLVRVAASFKRWDVRKDWFIKLMQYRPTTISLGSHAFVTREQPHDDEPRVFGERDFCMFFQALFQPLKDLSAKDHALFQREFGADPHRLIGDFLVKLVACPVG